jgi:ankyrin repeat protein
MAATQVGSVEIVTMLLDAGANPTLRSPMFMTALDIAYGNAHIDAAAVLGDWLKKEGVDTRIK